MHEKSFFVNVKADFETIPEPLILLALAALLVFEPSMDTSHSLVRFRPGAIQLTLRVHGHSYESCNTYLLVSKEMSMTEELKRDC
jgi:hypothetical protein